MAWNCPVCGFSWTVNSTKAGFPSGRCWEFDFFVLQHLIQLHSFSPDERFSQDIIEGNAAPPPKEEEGCIPIGFVTSLFQVTHAQGSLPANFEDLLLEAARKCKK